MDALYAAGVCKRMRLWLHIMYNEDDPTRRTVAVNEQTHIKIPRLLYWSPLVCQYDTIAIRRSHRYESKNTSETECLLLGALINYPLPPQKGAWYEDGESIISIRVLL